jgi:plasmid stabilization system protein ParE
VRLVWRASARADLREITGSLARLTPAAAREVNDRIEFCAERLVHHPYAHPAGRVLGTREALVHPGYAIAYRAGEDTIEIVSVLHTCRQFPRRNPTANPTELTARGVRPKRQPS